MRHDSTAVRALGFKPPSEGSYSTHTCLYGSDLLLRNHPSAQIRSATSLKNSLTHSLWKRNVRMKHPTELGFEPRFGKIQHIALPPCHILQQTKLKLCKFRININKHGSNISLAPSIPVRRQHTNRLLAGWLIGWLVG